jgi:hypothetical protein
MIVGFFYFPFDYSWRRYQHVFYIDATSATTIEADLKSIALAKHAGDSPSDALAWMARLTEEWLVVYNNADDTSLDLRQYFPACSTGKILVTTRNRRMITLAQGVEPYSHISEMLIEDAQRLLAKVTMREDTGASGGALIKVRYFCV